MARNRTIDSSQLAVRRGQTLVAIPDLENGQPIIRYFVDDLGDGHYTEAEVIQRVRALAGAWSDLDWDETEAELDRIRHSGTPSPPIDLDDIL